MMNNQRHSAIHCVLWCGVLCALLAGSAIGGAFDLERPTPADYIRQRSDYPVLIDYLDGSREETGVLQLYGGRLSKELPEDAPQPDEAGLYIKRNAGNYFVPLDTIDCLTFRSKGRRIMTSDARTMCLSLGSGPDRTPEPPGWESDPVPNAFWDAADVLSPNYQWTYLPGAEWIWAPCDKFELRRETVLFRRRFRVSAEEKVVSAVLQISADNGVSAVYLNGAPVSNKQMDLIGHVAQWDVTSQLRPGENLLAIRAFNAPTDSLDSAGLAYRLVIEITEPLTKKESTIPKSGVVAHMHNGDVVRGDYLKIKDKQLIISSDQTEFTLDLPYTRRLNVYYSSGSEIWPSPIESFLRDINPLDKTDPGESLRQSRSFMFDDDLDRDLTGIVFAGGEFMEGRIVSTAGDGLRVQPKYGKVESIPFHQIAQAYPSPAPSEENTFIVLDRDPLIVRLKLVDGSVITGKIEQLNASRLSITPQYGITSRVPLSQVMEILFLRQSDIRIARHLRQKWPGMLPRAIALIGKQEEETETFEPNSPFVVVQKIADEYGFDIKWFNGIDLLDEQLFHPRNFPLLINLDENGAYYHTIYRKGDAEDALKRFMEEGGHFIQCGADTPFSKGYKLKASELWSKPVDDDLNRFLEMNILDIDDRRSGAVPFELPPDPARVLYFEKMSDSNWTRHLPDKIPFPVLEDSYFRPITEESVRNANRFHPVYRLVDDRGRQYGIAMALIDGTSRLGSRLYIATPLARAEIRQNVALESLIPAYLLYVGSAEAGSTP